ncbi:MAG: aminopeptidase P family protein [Hoeflea sp.]|uniref:aminopeptidase P family protein n=1 Tax=Hoeflea sp. TaxID=1940281 RepID=UPI001DD193C8|nr:aminopeptidase P family protein [Hoeflea sp.]MBU4530929.1 aminopeptidase P family protein [Alphaproteobacteria bacterium]MBU4542704.1 aminopeptidase P family protein [Alphaproteobacteria bacterium]MBU4549369.1 aminopeptidase P family protein [Alphaproteobacteria bacterium]MBV1722821.1 aminopeptidase P family protein [Hoeflea sp.]MBV1761543.1 aminopeptidase P family protein [Hoeflea sp.]
MFQNFEVLSSPDQAAGRLARLRATLAGLGVDAIAVPRSDEYLGEYVPACAERLAWLTGFTGSAGLVLVLDDTAHIFVDGRYAAQVRAQTDPAVFDYQDLIATPLAAFLEASGREGLRLGIDPWTWPSAEVQRLEAALKTLGGSLVYLDRNPVDAIWEDRPAPPLGAVTLQPITYAGVLARDKLAAMAQTVMDAGADAVILADPSSVAWSFNIRGQDLPSTPHPLSRAIIPATGRPRLFIDKRKTGIEAEAYLTQLADIAPPSAFEGALSELGRSGATVMADPAVASHAISLLIETSGGVVKAAPDPARLPRACKNAAEIAGSAQVHVQDGAAMVRFLAWLDRQAPGTVDEIGAATRLEQFRVETGESLQMPLRALSFDTISGAGPNAAIMHYRVNTETNRRLNAGEMLLIDSGGQYVAGTTDITRTIAVGDVPRDQKRFFTLVLKGMIAISLLRFPEGTRGVDIDAFARIALWQAGADFAHGTGHGVGSYLSVHEGPQSISRRGMQALLPGMILSNEPGYYRDGAFGIRIENLVTVHEPRAIAGGDKPMLGFETLTLCPIDTRLIVRDLLDAGETAWLNAYHARVRAELSPLLAADPALAWLEAATEAL